MTTALIGFALGAAFTLGVAAEKHLRHRMILRVIRDQDAASMEEF